MTTTARGTSNGNARGGTTARRARRAWLMTAYASDVPGFARCFHCGVLLFSSDYPPPCIIADTGRGEVAVEDSTGEIRRARPLSIDRIIPGCQGGTYDRTNIRPACVPCNSSLGGGVRS